MSDIDYERLKLIVTSDISEEVRELFDIDEIVSNAELNNGRIIVKSHAFRFVYDAITYQQLPGCVGM